MPTPRTQPLATYERILEVMRQRDAVPSDKELATELNCSVRFVQSVMKNGRNSRKIGVPRGSRLAGAIAQLENTENADRQ